MPVSSNSLPCPVATDLDGTIVRSGGTISPRTVSALAHFRSARFAGDTQGHAWPAQDDLHAAEAVA